MTEEIKSDEFFKKLLKREKSAFKTLYEQYKIPLYRLVNSIVKNDELTADIIQDTFIKAIRKIHQLKDISKIEYWIFRIAVNITLNLLKKENRISLEGEMIESISNKVTARNFPKDRQQDDEENYYLLLDLIEDLPLKHKIVVTLKYMENFKEQEISEILSIPLGTVKSRLNIARNKIKAMIAEADNSSGLKSEE